MSENRKKILDMLADGKLTAEEAERLIAALEKQSNGESPSKGRAKYLRVLVESTEHDGPTKVNVRVPMQLLRAGVKLASLIPPQAHQQVNSALREHGVQFDLSQLKPENLEELVDHLDDLTVDIAEKNNATKVRVFCE